MRRLILALALLAAFPAYAQLGNSGLGGSVSGGGGPVGTGPTFVSAPSAGSITSTGATISSTTSSVTTAKVYYCTGCTPATPPVSSAYGSSAGPDTASTTHAQALSSLTTGATYHFQQCVTDAATFTQCSPDATFLIPSAYVGPMDTTNLPVSGTAKAFWGLRAATTAAASGAVRAVQIRRDGAAADTCDFAVNSSGNLGNSVAGGSCTHAGVSYTTYCSGVNCFCATFYDQIGTQNMSQATTANQPKFLPTGWNAAQPTCQGDGTTPLSMQGTLGSTIAQPFWFYAVAQRNGSISQYNNIVAYNDGTNILEGNFDSVTGKVALYCSSNFGEATATEGSRHALQYLCDQPNSLINVSGVDTTGFGALGTTGMTSGQPIYLFQNGAGAGGSLNGNIAEVGVISGGTASSTNLCHNARLYWTTAGSC